MQRRMPQLRRSSSEKNHTLDGADEDVLSQLHALSSSSSSATASGLPATSPLSDGLTLLVKGRPLTAVVQLLADALLQHDAEVRKAREATESHVRQTETIFADQRDALQKLEADVELAARPFSFSASGASRLQQRPSSPRRALHQSTAANTLADALRRTHQRASQTRSVVLRMSAESLATKTQRKQLSTWFHQWRTRGERRLKAKALELRSATSLLATHFARWKRRSQSGWRARQLVRDRHLRAVTQRSEKTILRIYLHKWEKFAERLSAETARLSAYQRRVAHAWSVSGPAVTACRRDYYTRWKQWAAATAEQKRCETEAHSSAVRHTQTQVLRVVFSTWHRKSQRRRVFRLYHRLARVLAAQNCQVLLRCRFRAWLECAERSRRLRRLEMVAADQHKRRVTALARRYFNELRFFRREQQFQRMMRSVEASLLTLADRVSGVESVLVAQSAPPIRATSHRPLFVSPPREALYSGEEHGRSSVRVEWSPAVDEELLSRVNRLLERQH